MRCGLDVLSASSLPGAGLRNAGGTQSDLIRGGGTFTGVWSVFRENNALEIQPTLALPPSNPNRRATPL